MLSFEMSNELLWVSMEEEEDGVDPIGEDSHTDTDIQNVSYLVVFELFRKL
jgi:hypothetical protein